jgi:hypothetical protein
LERFGNQARQMNIYDGIFLYNENNLDKNFRKFFKDKLKLKRGAGYWVWKPHIILKTLEKLNEGDLLQYTDAGCHLNPKGLPRLNEYFDMASDSETGLLAFELPWVTEKQYAKGDLFDYFGVRDDPDIYPAQIAGGILFVRKCEKSIAIIKQWQKVFYDDFALIDDSPSKSSNFPEFIENRHDQSVWSILVKLNGVPRLSHSEQCKPFEKKYPIWVLRDKARTATFFTKIKLFTKKLLKRLPPAILYRRLKEIKNRLCQRDNSG